MDSREPLVEDRPSPTRRGAWTVPVWTWHAARVGLLVGWLVLLVAAVGVGERPASYERLEAAAAAGELDRITVHGGLPDGATGSAGVTIRWQDGAIGDVTVVTEASLGEVERARRENDGQRRVIAGRVVDRLTTLQPGLEVRRGEGDGFTPTSTFVGLMVPTSLGLAATLLVVASLLLLAAGREPWRATRWAWAWAILFLTPLGSILFLALSGPTPGLPAPRPTRRRNTGGWTLVLVLLLDGFLGL